MKKIIRGIKKKFEDEDEIKIGYTTKHSEESYFAYEDEEEEDEDELLG